MKDINLVDGNRNTLIVASRNIFMDPSMPFIYIPDTDFTLLSGAISTADRSIRCNFLNNYCKWELPCD
jgi:hypothetical protein